MIKKKENQYAFRCLAFVLIMSVCLLLMRGFGNAAEWIGKIGMMVTAVMLIMMGCCFPRCKKGSTLEIGLPWTVQDEENRDATHRFAGTAWVVCGVLALIGINSGNFSAVVVFAVIALLLPVVYSFRMSRKKKR